MIKTIISTYTGGGVWIFYGQLTDGNWFLTDSDGLCVEIVNKSPQDFDESLYCEWIDAHRVKTINDPKELKDFLGELATKCTDCCDIDFLKVEWED